MNLESLNLESDAPPIELPREPMTPSQITAHVNDPLSTPRAGLMASAMKRHLYTHRTIGEEQSDDDCGYYQRNQIYQSTNRLQKTWDAKAASNVECPKGQNTSPQCQVTTETWETLCNPLCTQHVHKASTALHCPRTPASQSFDP